MKKNIAILAGGNSSEEIISLKSAETIQSEIDKTLFTPFVVEIKGTKWVTKDNNGNNIDIDKNDFSFLFNGEKIKFDCAYIIIHGTPGEDGKLQGYLDTMNVPYTSCDVLTSALTFNKHFCKIYLQNFEVLAPKGILVKKRENIDSSKIIKTTGLPCFVKPNAGGSSFGISKVKKEEDLIPAIENAFAEDNFVLIEEALTGREITCGLVKKAGKSYTFPITEIVSKNEFFDYDAKYTTGMAEEITPALISSDIEKKCKELSSTIYDALNCKGIVRIDYMLNNNELHFFEVNTVPGMSKNSIIPQQIKAAGYSVKEVLTWVIQDALTAEV